MREYDLIADWYATDRGRTIGVAEALAVAATLPAHSRILDAEYHKTRTLWIETRRSRAPSFTQAKGAMPADQSSWFDDDQGAAPIEEASELGKDEAIRSCCRLSSFLTFLK